jgi:hypothetical protein
MAWSCCLLLESRLAPMEQFPGHRPRRAASIGKRSAFQDQNPLTRPGTLGRDCTVDCAGVEAECSRAPRKYRNPANFPALHSAQCRLHCLLCSSVTPQYGGHRPHRPGGVAPAGLACIYLHSPSTVQAPRGRRFSDGSSGFVLGSTAAGRRLRVRPRGLSGGLRDNHGSPSGLGGRSILPRERRRSRFTTAGTLCTARSLASDGRSPGVPARCCFASCRTGRRAPCPLG